MGKLLRFIKTYLGLIIIILGLSIGWSSVSDYITIAIAGIITLFLYEMLTS
ncbi:MAG: hypothetical protein N3G77_02250 [Nitrososphaeria archaeon]|nr:hypothetical protein [Nitrososphaeria archaeon]